MAEKISAEEVDGVTATFQERAAEILKNAKEKGVENSFMFETTFQRYIAHLAHLQELQKAVKEHGTMVTKEYVKGRCNLYVNPALNAYNSTAGAADKTAQLLIRYIVNPLKDEDGDSDKDAFDLF